MSLGATWGHYHGNVTRTAALGKVSTEAEKRLKIVIDAQEAAFDAAKPGVTFGDVYNAAQKELEKGELRECSMSLGHCIGADLNERPLVSPGDKTLVEEGMVLSLDVPYLDLGWGGLEIGPHCNIAAHCVLATVGHDYRIKDKPMSMGSQAAPIVLEEDVWLCANVTVTAGVRIAKGCVIGANAVVTKDTEPMGLYVGVPARRLRDRFA
jgi:acetyltransferase-like isoleucine patch superfamily enzyme